MFKVNNKNTSTTLNTFHSVSIVDSEQVNIRSTGDLKIIRF